VRVIAKRSVDLKVGIDLAERADVLICDTFGNNMIGAGAFPAMEHAVRRLMRPGAPAIPARGTVRIALAEDRKAHLRQMHIVEGFDLSPFNRLAEPRYTILNEEERLALRSEPGDLFRFDFQSGGPFPEARASLSLSASGGLVNGIAQWSCFDLDDEVRYENLASAGTFSVFAVLFHPFKSPIEMTPGAELLVCGSHDRHWIRIWAEFPKGG
jgi:hypothetical protein